MAKYKNARIKVEANTFIGIVAEVEGKRVPYLSIKDSTILLGYKHSQYTRRLLLEGKLDTPYPPIKVKEGKFSKWYIPIYSLKAYLESKVERDSRRRFTLRVALEDRAKVEKALKASGVEFSLELSYKKGVSKKGKKESPPKEEKPLEEFTFSPE